MVVGRLLASVSHELNNPIQAIQNALFLIKEEETFSEQGRQDLEIIISETERMAALIDRLRTAYRPTRSEDYQDVQVNDLVEYVRTLTATHMRHNNIRFEFQPAPDPPIISGNPEQLRQVFLNLFMNAIEAMREGGQLTVRSEHLPSAGKNPADLHRHRDGDRPAVSAAHLRTVHHQQGHGHRARADHHL